MQKLQLTIPEPCHENWQQMTPTDQGRFCNACAKEVIDFSTMTDIQVLNYFTNMTHEKVCGRALPEQLDRTISRPAQPKKRLFWYWNYIVMFFMFFGKGNSAKAQGSMKVTTEQLNLIKSTNINNALAGKVAGPTVNRIITGKVIDVNGNPVSFASIKIKGANTAISADANGVYSIKVNPNAILFISGATFKSVEVAVGSQSTINTVLEKIPGSEFKEIYGGGMLGGISYRNSDLDFSAPDKTRAVAIIRVKDEATGKYLPKASVVINSDSFIDTVFTDAKGIYKIKGIKSYDRFYIKVKADGYESNEFTINENDFKNRKKEWEVLLRKQKTQSVKSIDAVISGTEKPMRMMGSFSVVNKDKGPIYVVDGTIMPNEQADIKPEDVDNITVLKSPEAAALFGPDGANGAIVITTRKTKVKNLKEIVVTSDFGIKRTCRNSPCLNTVNLIQDSIRSLIVSLNGNLKIYPNPVQRGEQLNIALKLKQAGLYQVQINDATGRIVLTKQISANSKDVTEKILADNRWSSGVYYISIIDEKNNLINKSSFIVR